MKAGKSQHTGNANGSGTHGRAQTRAVTFPIFILVSVVVILGCVSIMPRSSQQEETLPTIELSPVERATQPAPPTTTMQPSPMPVTETQESECSRLDLTSQECASLGQHWFTLSGVVDGYCWYGMDDRTVTRDLQITVSFANEASRKKVTITNAAFTDCTASSSAGNTYTYDCIADDGNHHSGTITFVDNGFLNEGGFTNSVNKNCTWSESYRLP